VSALRWCCALLVVGASAGVAPAQEPLGRLELRLDGPLEQLSLSAGGGPTRVRAGLGPGETRRVSVPVRLAPGGLAGPFEASSPLDRVQPLSEVLVPDSFESLPRRLRVRGLPPLERELPTPGPARWALLLATVVLVLAARRYPWRALLVGSLGAAALWLPLELPSDPSLILLEGDAASGRWLEVRAARDELELGAGDVTWLRTLPAGAATDLEVELGGSSPALRISAPGARLFALREPEARPRLSLEENQALPLEQVWVRSPDGSWSCRGPWQPGAALPMAPAGEAAELPGWLAAGLPQGVAVLVGRADDLSGSRWVRLVGP
jgi:hypothetical protein